MLLEALIATWKCSEDTNRSGLPTANNYLFADLLFFTDGEGDEATSPSFLAANKGNDASSVVGSAHCNKANAVGMRVGGVYPRQTTTCLPIFSFLRAERAKRHSRPLLQQATSRFKLPTHRWKRSFQLGAFSGDANANSFPTANKYLFADLLLFMSGEGDEATSPSFATENSWIDASSALLEALIAT